MALIARQTAIHSDDLIVGTFDTVSGYTGKSDTAENIIDR